MRGRWGLLVAFGLVATTVGSPAWAAGETGNTGNVTPGTTQTVQPNPGNRDLSQASAAASQAHAALQRKDYKAAEADLATVQRHLKDAEGKVAAGLKHEVITIQKDANRVQIEVKAKNAKADRDVQRLMARLGKLSSQQAKAESAGGGAGKGGKAGHVQTPTEQKAKQKQ